MRKHLPNKKQNLINSCKTWSNSLTILSKPLLLILHLLLQILLLPLRALPQQMQQQFRQRLTLLLALTALPSLLAMHPSSKQPQVVASEQLRLPNRTTAWYNSVWWMQPALTQEGISLASLRLTVLVETHTTAGTLLWIQQTWLFEGTGKFKKRQS